MVFKTVTVRSKNSMRVQTQDKVCVQMNELFATASAQPNWEEGYVVQVDPRDGVNTYWVRLYLPGSSVMADVPYTDEDFDNGIIRKPHA